MLHGTSRNENFERNTSLQCSNNAVTIRNNVATMYVATLCCAKNRLCESSRVTSPKRKLCSQRFAFVVVYCIFSELTQQDGRGKNTANLV